MFTFFHKGFESNDWRPQQHHSVESNENINEDVSEKFNENINAQRSENLDTKASNIKFNPQMSSKCLWWKIKNYW